MGDHPLGNAAHLRERADHQWLRYANAKTTGDEFVPDETLRARQFTPGRENGPSLLGFVTAGEREEVILDPNVQRPFDAGVALGEEQRDRLGEIADRRVALIEQPLWNPARLRGPIGKPAHWNQPLRPPTAQKVNGPCRVRWFSMRKVLHHRIDLFTGACCLVDGGDQSSELPHATISSPATARSCSSPSPSPSHPLNTDSACTPCSTSHFTTGSR